jgi:uncharacterized membrane protein YGL010W
VGNIGTSEGKIMVPSFIANYQASHTHPLNHATHAVGIPLILVSLVLVFFNWRWALGLFVAGWIFQFIGHLIEGNKPAFFSNPVYLLIGPLWLLRKIGQALPRQSPRSGKSV